MTRRNSRHPLDIDRRKRMDPVWPLAIAMFAGIVFICWLTREVLPNAPFGQIVMLLVLGTAWILACLGSLAVYDAIELKRAADRAKLEKRDIWQ